MCTVLSNLAKRETRKNDEGLHFGRDSEKPRDIRRPKDESIHACEVKKDRVKAREKEKTRERKKKTKKEREREREKVQE